MASMRGTLKRYGNKVEKDKSDPHLWRNAKEYIYNHKYRDAAETTLHFTNITELKNSYKQKLEQWQLISEKICGSYMPLNYVTMRLKGLFIIEKQWKTLNIQKPNPRR